MNFKLTLWKTIISIVLGVAGGFYYWVSTMLVEDWISNQQVGINPPYYPWIFSAIIIAVVIYLIWSFVQKKK